MKELSTTMIVLRISASLICLMAMLSGCGSRLQKETDAFVVAGDYETALKLIDSFIQEHPQQPIGPAMRAKVLAASGKTEQALKEYQRFYTLNEKESSDLLLQILLGALNDDHSEVRLRAAHALGELDGKRAVPTLIEALSDDHWGVRHSAVRALGELGDKRVVPALIKTFNDNNSTVRSTAVRALGKLGDKSVLPILIDVLNDDDSIVQREAIHALGELGDKRAVPTLIEAFSDDHWGVRHSAVRALGNLRAVSALIETLNDDHWDVRGAAVRSLGRLRDKRPIPVLTELLGDEKLETGVKVNVVKVLLHLMQ